MGNYVSDKKNAKFIGVKLSVNTDADIIEHLGKQTNVQGYIKALIRADIAAGMPGGSPEKDPTNA